MILIDLKKKNKKFRNVDLRPPIFKAAKSIHRGPNCEYLLIEKIF